MKLSSNPLFDAVDDAGSVLIAGAGGGFDVYSGLPLYFALRDAGKNVHLANYSFTRLPEDEENKISPACMRVTADTAGPDWYFPERSLSRWFRAEHQEEIPVFAFRKRGVKPLRAAYLALCELLALDAIVLVDGGTDSLMRGDESGLGTPSEDIASIAAVHGVSVPIKILSSIGFGVDSYHGVCHAQWLEAVAALTRDGAYLGTLAVLPQMNEAQQYLRAVEFATEHTALPSIVSTSIAAAVQGHYGDYHATRRTAGSKLQINPLMPVYWSFTLDAVYNRNLYVHELEDTVSIHDVGARIEEYRRQCTLREWEAIPV